MLYQSASLKDDQQDCDLTPRMVACELGKPLRMVQRLLLKGLLPGRKIRGTRGIEWRISREDLDAYIEIQKATEIDSKLVDEMLNRLQVLEDTIDSTNEDLNKAVAYQHELNAAIEAQSRLNETLNEQMRSKNQGADSNEKWWKKIIAI